MEQEQQGLKRRCALIPWLLVISGKAMVPAVLVMAGLSGFRAAYFSWEHLEIEVAPTVITLLVGWISGVVIGPLCLPWLPGEHASFKGTMAGGLGLLIWPLAVGFLHLRPVDVGLAFLLIPAMSSYWMMKLAGAGCFAPLAVELRERRVAGIAQACVSVVALTPWVMARFL